VTLAFITNAEIRVTVYLTLSLLNPPPAITPDLLSAVHHEKEQRVIVEVPDPIRK